MAKTLDEAGVKRLIQEIKGANKNLNAPIPISTENTTESKAQNVKNIADYVEKAKAAGIDTTKSFRLTFTIEGYPVEGSYDIQYSYICGLQITDDGFAFLYNIDVTTGEVFTPCEIVTARSMQKVTSSMLDKGARKPIILTPSTTEVDEETYQKLLSDDVDVVFNTDHNLCTLTYKIDSGSALKLYFTCFSMEAEYISDVYLYAYEVSITKASPHTCSITENVNDTLDSFLNSAGYLNEAYLNPILQESGLTGTDAERKAKLDQFEADWKALTGADTLVGARFVGKFVITEDIERNVTGIMTYSAGDTATEKNDNCFYGICNGYSFSKQKSQIAVKVSCKNGSLTITPLFSHLEAITIYTDNTPEHKQANLDNIAAYEANLHALGVDTTKGWNAPVSFSNRDSGILSYLVGDYYLGILFNNNNVTSPYSFNIRKSDGYFYRTNIITQASNISSLTTTSKRIVDAINEVNALAKSKQDKLTSGTNIKTVNGQSLLGSGDIAISGGGGDVTAAGDNTFTGNNVFSGIAIADILDGTQYQITGDNGVLMFTSGATNEDIQLSGVATPTYSNSAANKQYVDDKVAAAGGGSAPVLVNIDDISGSAGVSVPVDVFNKIANAASAKTPIFGYSKLVNGPRTTYEIIPLYVKNVSTTDTNGSLSIQFIAENAYNSIGIMKRSDTECSILISSSRPFALDTSVDKSSTRGIQSSAVWNEIHSEPMTINTATSGVTTLSSTDKHKILCYADSGTQQYNLPTSPVDGETFLFLKVKSGHTITIQSGTGNENIYDCSSGNSVVSKTIETSTKRKITVTYSSTVGKWFLMANDFLS